MQAKFLHFYPGYTWDKMMEPRKLPFSVFMSMYGMIEPVGADNAIEIIIPAISSIMSGKMEQIKNKVEKVFELKPEFETEAAKIADRQNSYRASSAIRKASKNKQKKTVLKKQKVNNGL